MKIYSMTATFGKLQHETLTLQSGLNIVHAPNEWGKSTWCAFLVAMLYGLDTRAKSTKTALADKERYAPWSGSPMAGRIDLNWNGRDITIERQTKRRVPLGEFRAYETETGLDIPELTAANCGQLLLGVERSVFLRSGFIRFSDLPVTQDEALRRRLNALVTTGDESATADKLAGGLRDLKNRCRYNKSGLLPQAELERSQLEGKLRELESYENQLTSASLRLEEVKQRAKQLENHQAVLSYEASKADAQRVAQAQQARDAAKTRLELLAAECEALPDRRQAERAAEELRQLHQSAMALDLERQMLPSAPAKPDCTDPETARKALEQAEKHSRWLEALYKDEAAAKRVQRMALIYLIGALPIGVILWLLLPKLWIAAAVAAVPALAGLILLFVAKSIRREVQGHLHNLQMHYGSLDGELWVRQAQAALTEQAAYTKVLAEYEATMEAFRRKQNDLAAELEKLTQGQSIGQCLQRWEAIDEKWENLADAQRAYADAEKYANALAAMAKTVRKPEVEDNLTYSEAETLRLLTQARLEQQDLQNRMGQYQGRMEALGQKKDLEDKLGKVNERIAKLEDTYAALALAQQTLTEAAAQLQRRFAPKIASRAQELMGIFTGGRYDRLSLSDDFSLRSGAEEEDVLHEALWRSDGTMDQLYLALRLAVSEELTPDAPLILDDALVRFDDERLKAAVNVLRAEAEQKQVILFSCHSREKNI